MTSLRRSASHRITRTLPDPDLARDHLVHGRWQNLEPRGLHIRAAFASAGHPALEFGIVTALARQGATRAAHARGCLRDRQALAKKFGGAPPVDGTARRAPGSARLRYPAHQDCLR